MDFLLVIAHLAVAVSDLNSCQPVSKHFYKKYSTKTPYQYIVDELGELYFRSLIQYYVDMNN